MAEITDVVCSLCGCVCDDIVLDVENNEVVKVKRGACSVGKAKLLGHHRIPHPMIRENGQLKEVSYDEAIKKSAEILYNSRRPLMYGWSSTVCEADKVGVLLAEELGAVIDNTASVCHGPSVLAIQDVGLPSCTLGEVKNRADLIIYWGANPAYAHANHMKRYSYVSKGFWTQEGKKDKKLVIVDPRKTMTTKMADVFVQIKQGYDYPVFSALRAILRGHADIVPDEVGGVSKAQLMEIAEMVKGAKFVMTFFGMGVTHTGARHNNIVNAIQFTRAAHTHTKASIMPLRGHYNVAGINQVLTWETGFPFAIDMARGYPWYNPGEDSATDCLWRGDCDSALIIASDPGAHFPGPSLRHMAKIPVIQIDPFANPTTEFADIIIPTAVSGIDAEGSVYRMDNIPIRLRKIIDSDVPTDEEILERMLTEIRALRAKEVQ
ncbi:MAG TPA: formylmethanofuran dehydrogenase subunit B [Methanomicrobia archaeon]|nr:formylmethanofuran dehydrogenase subunit B [Methanomicrobia archaeon]